jgi:N6-L-threonylcarbamoyladenine synthase
MSYNIPFPFLTLLISGGTLLHYLNFILFNSIGHSLLVVCRGVGQYQQLGTCDDDSVGEAYDKVARLFDLEWDGGGGKALEKIAKLGIPVLFTSRPSPVPHHCFTS